MTPGVLQLSFSDSGGGASTAARRLHLGLLERANHSRMRVAVKRTDLAAIDGPATRFGRAANFIRPRIVDRTLWMLGNREPRSLALLRSGIVRELNSAAEALIHLHWICGEMISVAEIGRIKKPLIWTLHDSWPLLGTRHLVPPSGSPTTPADTWRQETPGSVVLKMLDNWSLRRKMSHWKTPMTLVCPSRWLEAQVSNHAVCGRWPTEVIPNAIDTASWKPYPQPLARQALNLPPNARLALFAAMGGTLDHNKGADLLRQSLLQFKQTGGAELQLVVLGQERPQTVDGWPVATHWLGTIDDEAAMQLAYSSADMMLLPSRVENLPYAAIEAQSCGLPVIAFSIGGIPEIVTHGETGLLAPPYDTARFARLMEELASNSQLRARLSMAATESVRVRYSNPVVVARHEELYSSTLDNFGI